MQRELGLVALLAALAGCASSPRDSKDVVNTGLDALGGPGASGQALFKPPDPHDPAQVSGLAAQSALDLQAILDSGVLDKARHAPAEAEAPKVGGPDTEDGPDAPQEGLFVGPPAPAADEGDVAEAPAPPADPLVELAHRMATLLREPAEAGRARVPYAVALAPLEAMRPGVLADLEMPSSALGVKLTPEDRRTLVDARDEVLSQPGLAADSLTRALAKMAPPPALKMSRTALCTRVQGFGRFDAFTTDTFVVGRPIRAIVYVELDGFVSRPARDSDPIQPGLSLSDQLSVELSQSLTLYHDPSGLQAWHKPAKAVMETGLNKRRDFYLVQQVELPASLTVGRYNLKVMVKDKTSGSEAEAVLPVNIVADESALTRVVPTAAAGTTTPTTFAAPGSTPRSSPARGVTHPTSPVLPAPTVTPGPPRGSNAAQGGRP